MGNRGECGGRRSVGGALCGSRALGYPDMNMFPRAGDLQGERWGWCMGLGLWGGVGGGQRGDCGRGDSTGGCILGVEYLDTHIVSAEPF